MDKTKFISNVNVTPTPVRFGDSTLKVVEDYICLGQTALNPSQLGGFQKAARHFLVPNTIVSQDESF